MLPALMLAAVRPGAAFLAAPFFGAPQVPVFLRFILALAVGVPGSAIATVTLPPEGMVSLTGFLIVANEAIIGAVLGFALQTGFAASLIAGETIGNAMGLGLAATVDPMTGSSSLAVSQVLSMLATMMFLSIDGHLAFVTIIVESWRALPVGGGLISAQALWVLATLGGAMFASAATLAMPVVTGVILIQLVMAMLARSAPAMNLFAVGLPAALLGGLVLFAFATPMMAQAIIRAMIATLGAARALPL